ncbi:MAG: HDIG domain-containing protein [Deltaproteobacteria bacterium]|nr:HDIG domain-containing protein [Deltaproteobacteria bacterium]
MRELFQRLGARIGEDVLRGAVLLLVSAACAFLLVDYTGVPSEELAVGDVAPRTVEAPLTFRYQDFAERDRRQVEARQMVPAVYVYRADLAAGIQQNISQAYAAGLEELTLVLEAGGLESPEELPELPERVVTRFREALGVHVPPEVVAPLARAGFAKEAETLSKQLFAAATRGPIIADMERLPPPQQPITIIEIHYAERVEQTVTDRDFIITPAIAREQLDLRLLSTSGAKAPWVDAAATVARASIRHDLDYDHLETQDRRERAAASVPMAPLVVKRGTTLFRQGDVLTELDLVRYRALQSSRSEHTVGYQAMAIALFLLMLLGTLYHFGSTYLAGFSTQVRDTGAAGLLLVFIAVLVKLTVGSSDMVADLVGAQAEAGSVWFVVPVAGAAMLVRLLIGVSWTLVFTVAAAVLCGLAMDFDALYVVFFLISAVAGAGAVEHTRERLAVLRAGLFAGVVNAATVLLIHFLQLFMSDGEVTSAIAMRPVWSMGFGFLGGIFSSFMVLALMPLFESIGFVTDYRLLELANLNHPLLRQLMLRAPGSYHHSVIVGSLAEAASEAIGANALQARVAAYFHDVGKSAKPRYFVENQRGGLNRHDRLNPYTSARAIVAHVIEGGRMAREHNLPKPIVDNVYMHHGTGLLQYFHAKAVDEAEGEEVAEAPFRYPGPTPDTREAGILMLADKIEAATRTIQTPTEENVRQMINLVINSVMADGQFEDCPLTFQELYTIADTFVQVLMGIYHQRIEYPQTAAASQATAEPATPRPGSVITLELPALTRRTENSDEPTEDEPADYEAVENLPQGE